MLTIEQVQEVIQSPNLKDEEINQIRNELVILADLILDIFFEENKPCQNQKE